LLLLSWTILTLHRKLNTAKGERKEPCEREVKEKLKKEKLKKEKQRKK
jgi:hypothetical protein